MTVLLLVAVIRLSKHREILSQKGISPTSSSIINDREFSPGFLYQNPNEKNRIDHLFTNETSLRDPRGRFEGRHAIVNCDILRRSRSQLRGKYFREMLRARQFSNARLEKRREKEEKSLSPNASIFPSLSRRHLFTR